MADLQKRLCELLHELPQNRGDFEELQQRYDSQSVQQRELKNEIDMLNTELKTLRTQLDFTNKALHKCEENYSISRESAVKHRLGVEASSKTIETMKDQATKLHLENAHLKKRLEELERNARAESFFRESCTAKQTKTAATIESLSTQMKNLEKDYKNIQRHANEAIAVGKKSQLMIDHKDHRIAEAKAKIEQLTSQIRALKNERKALEEDMIERKPEQDHVKEIFKEWQTSVNEVKTKQATYEKDLETLQQSLQKALNAQTALQKVEVACNEKINALEEKLRNKESVDKKKKTDCSVQTELNITIDVSCETARVQMKSIYVQTYSNQKESDQEIPVTTPCDEIVNEEESSSKSINSFPKNSSFSNSSLSELMNKFQKEKDSCDILELTQEMPTQVNPRLHTS